MNTWHKGLLKIFNFSGRNVLDVGCGDGQFIAHLRPMALSCKGIDPFAKNSDPDIILGYLEDNVARYKVDTVLCCEVIEHIISPNTLVDAVRKVLESDGVFMVTTPNAFHVIRLLSFINNEHHDPLCDPTRAENPEHLRLWSLKMMKRMLKDFKDVKILGVTKFREKIYIFSNPFMVHFFSQHLIGVARKK